MQGKTLLVDTFLFKPHITESKDGKLIAKGEFARANVPTANKRLYSNAIWEKSLKSVKETMDRRALYGELDHPEDGKTKLKRVSHIITELKFDGSLVYGEAEIMDTPNGKILQEIAGSGAAVGVSSRGMGSVSRDRNGNEVVQDDYNFITFDFVVDPANATSWPGFERVKSEDFSRKENFREEGDSIFSEENMSVTINSLDDLKKHNPDVYEKLMESARSEMKNVFSEEAASILREEKEKLERHVESKLLSDPGVAGAKTVLEGVVKQLRPYLLEEDAEKLLREKQEELNSLRDNLRESNESYNNMEEAFDKLTSVCKSLGLQLYFEKLMSNLSDKEIIESVRDRVGDASDYESLSSLKEGVATSIKGVLKEEKAREQVKERVSEKIEDERRAREKAQEESRELKRKNSALKEAAQKGVNLANELAIKSYIAEKLWNDPRGKKIKKVLENEDIETKEDVDERIEELKERFPLSRRFRSVGDGVDSVHMNEGISFKRGVEDRKVPMNEDNSDSEVFGVALGDIRNLSGY